jgi:large subunit ribosomal protein L24
MRTTKPSKQRKALFQAPDHRRHKLFAAPLSSNLRSTHGVKTLPVRSGDTVRIMRGDHEGFEGKITRVDPAKYRIYVEGLTREKVDGTTIFLPIHPSKVTITNLNLDDKWRKEILERKKGARKKAEAKKKPKEEAMKEAPAIREEAIAEKAPVKERAAEKKPKRERKRATKKPAVEQKEKEAEKTPKKEEPKEKKTRTRRKAVKKKEGGT